MPPAFLTSLKNAYTTSKSQSVTNSRKPLEVGLKLAIMLGHLATGKTYMSLQYHWLVGRTTICKLVPQVCCAILDEFKKGHLCCPTDAEDWKNVEKFRTRWNVPDAVGAIDLKHIAMKKPNKSRSDYYNYKDFFSLVLLALIDAEYRFLWVNVGSSGSSSDPQIFN